MCHTRTHTNTRTHACMASGTAHSTLISSFASGVIANNRNAESDARARMRACVSDMSVCVCLANDGCLRKTRRRLSPEECAHSLRSARAVSPSGGGQASMMLTRVCCCGRAACVCVRPWRVNISFAMCRTYFIQFISSVCIRRSHRTRTHARPHSRTHSLMQWCTRFFGHFDLLSRYSSI